MEKQVRTRDIKLVAIGNSKGCQRRPENVSYPTD